MIILRFYVILRVFVLYSHYGYNISNKTLNGHQAFAQGVDLAYLQTGISGVFFGF